MNPASPRGRCLAAGLLGVGLAVVVLAACTSPAGSRDAEIPHVAMIDGDVALTCGGPVTFPPAALEHRSPATDQEAVQAALDAIVAEQPADVPPALAADPGDWFVLTESSQEILLATGPWTADGPANDEAMTIGLERGSDGYRATDWGPCWRIRPALSGEWTLWADLAAPTLSSLGDNQLVEIPVLVGEGECVGVRDPSPFLNEPTVIESEDAVTIYWTSNYFEGKPPGNAGELGWTCPGNPPAEKVVTLTEPLGDRPLLDGSRWPAQDVRGEEPPF